MTSRIRRVGHWLCASGAFFLTASLAGPAVAPPVTSEWARKWQADLQFLAQKLPETHPNAFHAMERTRFGKEIRQLSDRAPSLSHPELVVGLARIVAGIGDGHTRVTLSVVGADDLFTGHSPTDQPRDPALVFHAYPIRLHWYSDGLHVQRITSEHAPAAGARVLAIGRTPAEEAIAKVSPAVSADNEMQRKDLIPQRLVVAELLAALGIVELPVPADFHLQTPDGKRLTIRLSPAGPRSISWADARRARAPVPQSAKRNEEPFWFE